jgi:hypothetical protein
MLIVKYTVLQTVHVSRVSRSSSAALQLFTSRKDPVTRATLQEPSHGLTVPG